jgi:VWFA-related protein
MTQVHGGVRRLHLPALATCGLLLALGLAALTAQELQTPARAVFRSGIEYVTVDVVATDKNDKPVTDLTMKDFEIREGGKPQEIRDFDHVVTPVVRRKVDLGATMPPASDVATNPKLPHGGRAFVFVVDDGAILPEDIVPLKRVMTEFLQSLSPDDQVALTYVKRSDLAQDFTNDLPRLVRAVNNGPAALGWEPDTRATRLTLVNVVSVLAASPETRRAIIYVSSGHRMCPPKSLHYLDLDCMTVDGNYFTIPGLSDLFDRARRADVPIYTLDPHGIVAPELGLSGRMEDQTPQHRASLDADALQRQQFLRTVAENTGGLAYVNAANPPQWANAIVKDNDSFYLLGYSPSPYVADGKLHPIEVTVKRPGVNVRFRKSYVATPHESAATIGGTLTAALSDGQPHSELPLRAFVVPMSTLASPVKTVVTLDVSYPAAVDQPRPDDDLDVVFAAVNPDGRILALSPQSYHVTLSSARREPTTISLDSAIELPRGQYTLRIGVASHSLGTVGTLHLPLDFRAPGDKGVDVTPLVLGLASGAEELVGGPDKIAQMVPFQPTTARIFSPSQQLRVFARAFAAAQDLTLELVLSRGGKTIRAVPVATTPSPSSAGAVDCVTTIALADLPPGDYALTLTALLPGGRITTRAVGFQFH